jgi:hypothetical protein
MGLNIINKMNTTKLNIAQLKGFIKKIIIEQSMDRKWNPTEAELSYEKESKIAETTKNSLEMRRLSDSENILIRKVLAQNPHIASNQEVVEKLSKDNDVTVRGSLASNPNAAEFSFNVLRSLVTDKEIYVVVSLANNRDLQNSIYNALSQSNNKHVLYALRDNPALPEEIKAIVRRKISSFG